MKEADLSVLRGQTKPVTTRSAGRATDRTRAHGTVPLVRNDGNSGMLEGDNTVSTISPRTTDLDVASAAEMSDTLRHLVADVLVLFVKTKGFHWHIGGRHFRDDHLLLGISSHDRLLSSL